ncbi:Uncharacterised protein [uncultured archaeon]|nr:Uncharacterised protein [uncultured archaeon]
MNNIGQQTITVNGALFKLVKKRTYDPIYLYSNEKKFLRIGPVELIKKELSSHKQMIAQGFPIAKILKEGNYYGHEFYIEESLGNAHLGEIFGQECIKNGQVSAKSFLVFKNLSKKFAKAQISNVLTGSDYEREFYHGFRFDYIIKELPQLKVELLKAFEKLKNNVSVFPIVITHGDLNPFNFLPKGIIDLEHKFYGPAGYDLVSAIYTLYFFPKNEGYEYKRKYSFTDTQIMAYFKAIDKIYNSCSLPKLSKYMDDFILARSVYAAVRMEHAPKLQKWRYELFNKILFAYLDGKSVSKVLTEFPS